jgi:hypothetical protein
MDGESLLQPSTRTSFFAEYKQDPANGFVTTWKMVRTRTDKYIQNYDSSGNVTFREYYNLTTDPAENTNTLGDANTANDPSAARITTLRNLLNSYAGCSGGACVK